MCVQQNVLLKILKESVNITREEHAPLKKRYVRANQSPFMNKKLNKEIMKWSRLRNKFLNCNCNEKPTINNVTTLPGF